MNAAFLMLTCCLAGGEKPPTPPPAPAPAPAPIVLQSAPVSGCGNCGNCAGGPCAGTADPMPDESKPPGGLFTKLKSKLSIRKKSSGGDCGGCGAAAPVASDSGGKATGLLSRIKSRLGGKKSCDGPTVSGGGCDTGCASGCGSFGAPGMMIAPSAPAGEGPKPMEKGKDGKTANAIPSGPLTPVAGPAIPGGGPLATAKSPF